MLDNREEQVEKESSPIEKIVFIKFPMFSIGKEEIKNENVFLLDLRKIVPLTKTIKFNVLSKNGIVSGKHQESLEYRESENSRIGLFSISGQLQVEKFYGTFDYNKSKTENKFQFNILGGKKKSIANSRSGILNAFWTLKYVKDRQVDFLDEKLNPLLYMYLRAFTLETEDFNFMHQNIWKLTMQFSDHKLF